MLVLYVSDAARARGLSSQVRHVTVMEEAHRLMPEPRAVGPEERDAGAVSAKLMAQLLAEIRAYGEGLLIIDQSPAAVSREVLRNTNVKLVHRIVDRDDQRALGGALGLDEHGQFDARFAPGRPAAGVQPAPGPAAGRSGGRPARGLRACRAAGARCVFGRICATTASDPGPTISPSGTGRRWSDRVALWTLGLGGDLRDRPGVCPARPAIIGHRA